MDRAIGLTVLLAFNNTDTEFKKKMFKRLQAHCALIIYWGQYCQMFWIVIVMIRIILFVHFRVISKIHISVSLFSNFRTKGSMNMWNCDGMDWSEQPESRYKRGHIAKRRSEKYQEVILKIICISERVSIGEWQLHPGGGHWGRDYQGEQGERTLNLCRNHRSSRSWKIH